MSCWLWPKARLDLKQAMWQFVNPSRRFILRTKLPLIFQIDPLFSKCLGGHISFSLLEWKAYIVCFLTSLNPWTLDGSQQSCDGCCFHLETKIPRWQFDWFHIFFTCLTMGSYFYCFVGENRGSQSVQQSCASSTNHHLHVLWYTTARLFLSGIHFIQSKKRNTNTFVTQNWDILCSS